MSVPYRFAAALAHADLALRRARRSFADARSVLAAAELAYDVATAADASVAAGPWATAWSLRDFEGWCAGQAARERAAAGALARARDAAAACAETCSAAHRDADRLERHRARDRAVRARTMERRDDRERDEANLAAAALAAATRGAHGARGL